MSSRIVASCTAFAGSEMLASGDPAVVARSCKAIVDAGSAVLVFDDDTAELVEMDFRGSVEDVLRRLDHATDPETPTEDAAATAAPRAPGRPRLGVVGREVTLLPRHWEWLNAQPGGASVALRKLVEQARRESWATDRVRRSQEVAYRFMSAMAGNEPGFEEASRALFASNAGRFDEHTRSWPPDVRAHAAMLAADALGTPSAESPPHP